MEQVLNGLALGLPVTLLGMGTVFAILAILWGMLELFRIFFYEIPKKKEAEAKAKAVPAPAPAPAVSAPAAAPSQDDDELLAVLAAAVAAAMGGSASSFRISSFRRAERSASVWNRTSISERTGSAL